MKRMAFSLCIFVLVWATETEDRIIHNKRHGEDAIHNVPQKERGIRKRHTPSSKYEYERDTIALIDEDFETGMPAGWTVIDGNNDGYTWTTGTTFDLLYVQPPNYGTAYAYYSDDDAGGGAPAGTEYLISPAVSCAAATIMTLSHSWGHNLMGLYIYGTTQVRLHDGISWDAWITLATYPYTANGVDTFHLDSYLPAESVQVQFTYEDPLGEWSFAFGIDNVLLEAEIPVLYVWDFETGLQGWTHTNNLTYPQGWDVQSSGIHASQAPPSAGDSCMWVDSDASGSGFWIQDTALAPVCTPDPAMDWMVYGICNYHFGGSTYLNEMHVGIMYEASGVWSAVELAYYGTTAAFGPAWDSVDVAAYATDDHVQPYFYFDDLNTWGYWACFDNVEINATVSGGFHDVGVTRILSPPMGGVQAGDYDWIARIQNLGDFSETGNVSALIYDTVGMVIIFSQTYTLTNFPPGGDTALDFGGTITVPNYYYCIVEAGFGDDNPANDTLTINSYVPDSLGQRIYWIDAQTPTSSMALHGVEYDGTYFYLTGITAIDSCNVFVLDTLGNLIWTIDQPAHCIGWGWRDMAFDRVYVGSDRIDTLYASCDINVDRFGINKLTGMLDYYGPLPGPTNPNRSLAYIPESLYFFTADMFHIYKFIKNGSFVDLDTTPWVLRGAAYDNDSVGGGAVWWSSLDTVDQFKMYDPNAMYFTGTSFGCDYPGSGLGFAQNFRDMDVLFSVMNLPEEDYIYGFFLRWSDSTGVLENTSPSTQPGLTLDLNLPNPIRKNTRFSLKLDKDCQFRLNVYDALGRKLKTVINTTTQAGTHMIIWDGKDFAGLYLPTGVYFLELVIDQETIIKKLVYLQ